MTAKFVQPTVESPFDARSTAEDVLDGIDLAGRTALVTGGYSGIGTVTTAALVDAGASVVVAARRPEVAREVLADLPGVAVVGMDLSDLASVRAGAEEIIATQPEFDIVINSAGVMASPEVRVGDDWELQFVANHLGHFALINRLHERLRPGARVISVASAGHSRSPIRWDDMMFRQGYDKWLAYGQSKTANALFALHLDTLARHRGIRSFSLHPGGIRTNLSRHLTMEEQDSLGLTGKGPGTLRVTLKTAEQGAATQLWAATSPLLEGLGGLYLEDSAVAGPWSDDPRGGVKDWAIDPDEAARLWAVSAELTGVDSFSR